MRVALENTSARRIAEASPHDKVWGIGLIASDPRVASPISWCGLNLLGQAMERTRDTLRQNTSGGTQPDILAPRDDDTDDTVFEVDPITHVRLNRSPSNTGTHLAQLSAFTDSVPDDHAPEVLLAYAQRPTAPLLPEQGPDLVSGVVTMDDATFICHYRVELLLHLGSTAAPSLIQGHPNHSSTKEPSIKWLPPAPPTHPTSELPHLNHGAGLARRRCSALADRPG